MKTPIPAIGEVFDVPYPFVRDTYQGPAEEGGTPDEWLPGEDIPTWRPGLRSEVIDAEGGCNEFADAIGAQLLTVVGVYKPSRFPTRVFYTRQWRDPDGRVFGKGGCRVLSAVEFHRLKSGFRVPFTLREHADTEVR